MEKADINQAGLAKAMGVSEGRVSQILNNPGNLTLKTIVQAARALGYKASIVAYDDGDPGNHNGPVNAQIFELCWERAGCPTDFFATDELRYRQTAFNLNRYDPGVNQIESSAGTTDRVLPTIFDSHSKATQPILESIAL